MKITGTFYLVLLSIFLIAAVPQQINFQGALKDADGEPLNTSVDITFKLYSTETGGTALWDETHVAVAVSGGIFNARLGESNPFSTGTFDEPELWITFRVSGDANEMSPRQRVLSVPYTIQSERSVSAVNAENSLMIDGIALSGLVQQDSLGNANIGGTMTATAFVGDGSGLTGITGLYDSLYIHSTGPDTMTANSSSAVLTINNEHSTGDAIKIVNGYQGIKMDSVMTGIYVMEAGYNGFAAGTVDNQGLSVFSSGAEGVYVQSAGTDGVKVYHAGSPTTQNSSGSNNGFEVNGAEGDGMYVGYAGDDGINIENAADNGVEVMNAAGDGVYVGVSGEHGANVYMSNMDGYHVSFVGTPSGFSFGAANNGFEVAGVEGDGLFVGFADVDGVHIKEALDNGIQIEESGNFGVRIDSTGNDGIYIRKAGNPTAINSVANKNGVEVAGAEGSGVYVGQADSDGLFVYKAGTPTTTNSSTNTNGVEVQGAEGTGVYVGRSDMDGFFVSYTGSAGFGVYDAVYYGLFVNECGADGLRVNNSDGDGIDVNTTDSIGEYGVYTPDKIYGSNVTTRTINSVGRNNGSQRLESGDIVCLSGYEEDVLGESNIPIIKVEKADINNPEAVIGVVEYKVSLKEETEFSGTEESTTGGEEITRKSFRFDEGNANQGDYVSIVVFGPADVKVDSRESIQTGQKLTVSGNTGNARSIKSTDNWTIGILGKALEDSNGKDTMKVFVNCK